MSLGLNRPSIFLVYFLIFSIPAFSQPLKSHKYHLGTGMGKSDIVISDNILTIHYSVAELEVSGMARENREWFKIGIPGHISSTDIGKPELPVFSRLITVPDGYTCSIRLSDIKSTRIRPSARSINGDLFPAQESETKNAQQQRPQFRMDNEAYSKREFIRSDTVKIEFLGKARGTNISTLAISPVRYNPMSKVLEVITSMKIDIIFVPSPGVTRKALVPGSVLFWDNLGKSLLNFTSGEIKAGYSDKPVRMIILTDTAFRKDLDPLVRWKTQKGIKIDMLYRGGAFAGNSYTEIKNSIAAIYTSSGSENPPPEYLLIVGNTDRIPYYGNGQVTDLYYGEFDGGTDYIPEMFIGRLPVADTSELRAAVSKIIQYEKFEFADTNKFHLNALAIAGIDDSHAIFMNGQVNYEVTNYLTPANNIREYHFLYPNARKDTIINLINRGVSFINYTGHGLVSGWDFRSGTNGNITTADVPSLSDINMYPFIISNACQTSRFSTGSLGNAMFLAKNKGAIGFIGASADSYWDEDYYWAVGTGPISQNPTYETTGPGALDRLFHTHGENPSEWYTTMGQVNFAGNLAVSSSTTSRKKYYWEIYNLVGDPSLTPIIGTPQNFTITLPDTLPNNLKSYSFIAEPFSYIAISHFDTLWDASYVSSSGSVTLDMPGLSEDSCLVVMTGQNRVPVIKTIYLTAINEPFINLSATAITDSLGNNDGKADYNETFFLKLTAENLGGAAAVGVTADVTTSSPFVTLIDGSAVIGTLMPGTRRILYDDLKFRLTGNIPDNSIVTLDVSIRYGSVEKHFKVDVTIHSPELEILHLLIDDTESGNGNFLADPGETISLVFSVLNVGSSSTSGQFSLSSPDPEITLLEPSKNSGTLDPGGTATIALRTKISEEAGSGSTINISALIDCNPFQAARSFTFRIGRFQETFESSSFRIFPWINVSPVPWSITQSDPYEGIIAAKSGVISHNQASSLIMKVKYSSPDSIRFYYKVSSELNYDYLIIKLNDTEVFRKSGEIPWSRKAIGVGTGINKVEWQYKKDGSESRGSDLAMIDLIDFAGSGSVTYINRDIVAVKLLSPVQTTAMAMEDVTIRVLNAGPDTIRGFNLAYSINDGVPVAEHFNNTLIYSGDTITVTFAGKADLASYGDYLIKVYSLNNNDDNLTNDTLKTSLMNNLRRLRNNIRIVDVGDAIHIGPNPFSDELNILIETEAEEKIRMILTGSMGRVMHEKDYFLMPGVNSLKISGKNLEPAVYFLKIEFPRFSKTMKVIRLNN